MALRRALHALGARYRLNRRIRGFQPDLLFPRERVAVFVDGCYWHNCPTHGPKKFSGPNADLWRVKIATNVARDREANATLAASDWRVIRVWECDIKANPDSAARKVIAAVRL